MDTFGQKGVNGGSKWRSGEGQTELGWMDTLKVISASEGMTMEVVQGI